LTTPEPSVKILTDDIEIKPTTDFQKISDTIVSFIKGSDPKFSVGVYGNWGTGKTTLMKLVESKLNDSEEKILSIWFNAWRYEREEHYATIALMKTIAYAMMKHDRYKSASKTIFNGLKIVGKDILKQLTTQTLLSEDGWTELNKKLTEKMKLLQEIDQDTIYFDGIQKLEEEMKKILNEDPTCKIVVFIDDLDRCSPKKGLEVLESMKVFLDIKGFVFIIGLSDQTVIRLITKEYEGSGVKGEDYIQKIIQLPIRIPPWSSSDIEKMIVDQIVPKLDESYSDFMKKNKDIIAIAVEPNPRELKRFINNLIVALEVFSELRGKPNGIKENELLIIEAIKTRWPNFYLNMITDNSFRKQVYEILRTGNPIEQLNKIIGGKKEDDLNETENKLIQINDDAWKFLNQSVVTDIFLGIRNWETYRRVTEVIKEKPKIISPDLSIIDFSESDEYRKRKIAEYMEQIRNQEMSAADRRERFVRKSPDTKELEKKIAELEDKLAMLTRFTSNAKDKKRKDG